MTGPARRLRQPPATSDRARAGAYGGPQLRHASRHSLVALALHLVTHRIAVHNASPSGYVSRGITEHDFLASVSAYASVSVSASVSSNVSVSVTVSDTPIASLEARQRHGSICIRALRQGANAVTVAVSVCIVACHYCNFASH